MSHTTLSVQLSHRSTTFTPQAWKTFLYPINHNLPLFVIYFVCGFWELNFYSEMWQAHKVLSWPNLVSCYTTLYRHCCVVEIEPVSENGRSLFKPEADHSFMLYCFQASNRATLWEAVSLWKMVNDNMSQKQSQNRRHVDPPRTHVLLNHMHILYIDVYRI